MSSKFTKRNHYNPCFWTACWNPSYYDFVTKNTPNPGKPREQDIYVLNLFADKIFPTKFAKVHFHENLGVAEISPESMKDFYKRRVPNEYDDFCNYIKDNPETLFIDFEETLTGIEQKGGYDSLIDAIKNEGVTSVEHKGFLSIVLILHAMRSYEMMSSMIEHAAVNGMEKWEYFWLLHNAWGNPVVLARAFPICDSPIMIGENSLMAILSPRLLLEINLNANKPEDHWEVKDGISFSKYREFRRRAIRNSFSEILFHDHEELEEWRKTPEFKERRVVCKDTSLAKKDIDDAANRVIFGLSGFGRVSAEVDRQIKRHFKG